MTVPVYLSFDLKSRLSPSLVTAFYPLRELNSFTNNIHLVGNALKKEESLLFHCRDLCGEPDSINFNWIDSAPSVSVQLLYCGKRGRQESTLLSSTDDIQK